MAVEAIFLVQMLYPATPHLGLWRLFDFFLIQALSQ
jgi:hypothetical protein